MTKLFSFYHTNKRLEGKILINKIIIIIIIKPRDHVTSYFQDLKIMPIKMLLEYSTLKLLLKHLQKNFCQLKSQKIIFILDTTDSEQKKQTTNEARGPC